MKRFPQIVVICVVLAVHVELDLLLLRGGYYYYYQIQRGWDMFLLAWPLGQASLIAIWAAISRIRSYVKFPAALLGVSCTWFVVANILEGSQKSGPRSAGWAVLLATQTVSILILTTAGHLIWRWIERRRSAGSGEDPRPVQFSLRFLLLWTTLLAVGLSLGQVVFARLGWTSEVTRAPFFYFYPVLAACNAACALIVLASLVGRGRLIVRIVLAAALVAAIGYFRSDLFVLLFGNTGGIQMEDFMILAGCQALYLYATLLPMRLCGCFGIPSGGKKTQRPGSPFAPAELSEK